MADQITVERTGRRPLRFRGELIAQADTSSHDADRWTEAKVYARPDRVAMMPPAGENWRPRGKGYVLALSHFTRWQGETDQHEAFTCDTAGELAANIEELPPAVADDLLEQLGIVEDLDHAEATS